MSRKVYSSILLFIVLLYLTPGRETPLWASSKGEKFSPFLEISGWKQSGEIQVFSPQKFI